MLLMVNLDDINLELLPVYMDGILKRGAKSVYAINGLTKKGRLGVLLLVDTEESEKDRVVDFIFKEMGTIGVRFLKEEHISLPYFYEIVSIELEGATFKVRIKRMKEDNSWAKVEFEDLRKIWREEGIPIAPLKSLLESLAFMEESEIRVRLAGRKLCLKKEGTSLC